MPKFRPAEVAEYVAWLEGHLADGGTYTHVHNYPAPCKEFLVALADFTTGGEAGSRARRIIVPQGVHHIGGPLGHNTLYLMDGFCAQTRAGAPIVPIFADAAFDHLPGVQEAREAQAAKDDAARAEMEARLNDSGDGDLAEYLGEYHHRRL